MVYIKESIRFILFVLLQVLVFRHLILFNYVMSFIYVAYLITVPLNTNRGLLMVLAFFFGVIIDIFYNTGGIHAFASVFVAYLRPFIIEKFTRDKSFNASKASISAVENMKWNSMALYSLIMIAIHHILVLFVEAASFHLFFYTLLKVIISTLFTYSLFLSTSYLLTKRS